MQCDKSTALMHENNAEEFHQEKVFQPRKLLSFKYSCWDTRGVADVALILIFFLGGAVIRQLLDISLFL